MAGRGTNARVQRPAAAAQRVAHRVSSPRHLALELGGRGLLHGDAHARNTRRHASPQRARRHQPVRPVRLHALLPRRERGIRLAGVRAVCAVLTVHLLACSGALAVSAVQGCAQARRVGARTRSARAAIRIHASTRAAAHTAAAEGCGGQARAALQRTVQNAPRRPQVNRVHRAVRAEHRLRQLRVACVEAVGIRAVHAAWAFSRLTGVGPRVGPRRPARARRASPACRRSTGAHSRSAQQQRPGRSRRSGRTRLALLAFARGGTRPSVTLARSSCAAAGRALRHVQLARSSPSHQSAAAGRCSPVLRSTALLRALSSQRRPAAASRCAA